MSPDSRQFRSIVLMAGVASSAMIAYQVAAKATRDAFFLSIYPVTMLPAMMAAASVLAVALAYAATRALTRWGPERLVPLAFAASAALLLIEWGVSVVSAPVAAVLLYLHYGCLGALLVSGFWSLLNERFDPRTAKRQLGTIGGAGTVGGLIGGLAASQFGRMMPVTAMLPVLAGFHLLAAFAIAALRPTPAPGPVAAGGGRRTSEGASEASGVRAIARTPYIRNLITLVVLVTISEGLIDLVLKGRAAIAFPEEGDLLQFFGIFYTGMAFLTVFVQGAAGKFILPKLGAARTAAIHPLGTAAASIGAIAIPGLTPTGVARGVESVFSNSFFRNGYEVLFTPVPAREKRAIKSLADVGASRLGDIVAAGLAQVVVLLPMAAKGDALLVMAVAFSALAVYIAYRLHAGYVQTLARGLVSRAVQLDIADVQDATTRSTVLQTLGPLALSQIFQLPSEARAGTPRPGGQEALPSVIDLSASTIRDSVEDAAVLRRIRDLHAREPARVIRALQEGPLPPNLVPHVIRLLGWDDVAREAIEALRGNGPEGTEPLVACLLDPAEEFTIRRRIPLVLGTIRDPRAVSGLLRGLSDRRFEVRYRCGRGLAHLQELDPTISIPREEVFAAVLREVEVGAGVWASRRLEPLEDEGWSPVADELLKDRADRSLEHVFTLLALVLPRQPLRIAFKGLHTSDPLLRGTALEYLESSLPPEIRRPLWPFLEDSRPRRAAEVRPREQVLQDLLQSSESIVIKLEELRKRGEG